MAIGSTFLTSTLPLRASSAVAAIVVVDQDRYLMQLRDDIPGIWYPGHWGLFGGAIDTGEDEIAALRRELREELELQALVHASPSPAHHPLGRDVIPAEAGMTLWQRQSGHAIVTCSSEPRCPRNVGRCPRDHDLSLCCIAVAPRRSLH